MKEKRNEEGWSGEILSILRSHMPMGSTNNIYYGSKVVD